MNERRLSALEEDWLAGNAVVAFVGALLMAQSWKPSGGVYELPFTNLTIPALHDTVYLALGTFLFVSSFALAIASVVRPLQSRAIRASRPFSTLLALLIWVAFILSWLGAMVELTFDQWWSAVLFFGGFAFLLFLGYRLLRAAFQSLPTEDGPRRTGRE